MKAKLAKLQHRDRPKTKAKRTRKPICHAASDEAREAYREAYKAFLDTYHTASAAYRSGCYDVEFPAGSFKPPLIAAAA